MVADLLLRQLTSSSLGAHVPKLAPELTSQAIYAYVPNYLVEPPRSDVPLPEALGQALAKTGGKRHLCAPLKITQVLPQVFLVLFPELCLAAPIDWYVKNVPLRSRCHVLDV